MTIMESLAFLESTNKKIQPIYVLHGDEDFLKRQVIDALRARVFGPDGDEFGLSTHSGDKATFAAVFDELQTLPFLSPRRVVLVENADPFVTRHRAALEKYVAQPAEQGILVLDVKSWLANTRLAKMVDSAGSIVCKAPAAYKLPEWCVRWTASQHDKQLTLPAARLLVELVGADMGQLDQELTKLAIYVGNGKKIDVQDVDQLVGSGRTANTFKIFDALAEQKPGEALSILDHLFEQGEDPLRMLGAFSMQLRRLAQTERLRRQGLPFSAAAAKVGIPPFALQGCERQLRHLGKRVEQAYDWLLEADQGMKGGSQLSPRTLLERLIVRLK
jgi:DNA polymerase-3 subunit delta